MPYVFEDVDISLVTLSEVYIQALSSDAYISATSSTSDFQNWLSSLGPVERGAIYATKFLAPSTTLTTFNDRPSQTLRYLIKSTAPTRRGTVCKNTGVLVSPTDHVDGGLSQEVTSPRLDGCEIDEAFMENGMLFSSSHHQRQRSYSVLARTLHGLEDDHTIYVHTEDLARCGLLDRDWSIVRSNDGPYCRLIRVRALDSMTYEDNIVYASPVLRYNMMRDSKGITFNFRSTSCGFGPPAIPTARVATVARIASPITVDKSYHPLFLQMLHEYFKERPRLMQKGDVIAVALDTDETRWTAQGNDMREMSSNTENVAIDCSRPYMPPYPNGTAYFTITNIECDPMASEASYEDLYAGIATGEWGCWIDSSVTRIVQTGIEHARVPSLDSYFGLDLASPSRMALSGKLAELVAAALTSNALTYRLQLSVIVKGSSGVGKMTMIRNVAQQLNLHVLELDCFDVIGENDTQTEGVLRSRFDKAALCSPCIFVLRHIDALGQMTQDSEPGKALTFGDILSECIESLLQSWSLTGCPVIVVATTNRAEETHARITSCFKHELDYDVPEENERQDILRTLTDTISLAPDVSLKEVSVQTAALVASDMVDLVSRGKQNYMKRALRDSGCNASSLSSAGMVMDACDLAIALNKARATYSESIGAPKIPNVSWDDVGGLAHVKTDILDTIQLPLQHPELFSRGLKKRSGILLYGPPGTGKTLLAKAVATSCSLNFFSVKGPELLNMYIGESEANVRRVFQRARDAKPCVIFFDELDSVAPKRGAHGDSGGVMDRIVSQILAELDGVAAGEAGGDVFVIGATNRPDLLDPALLRPGRFDRMLYLGVSQTHEAQLNILQALTRKFKLHPDLVLERIAEACPFHYTGADFYALCSDALLKAMSRTAEDLDAKIAIINAGPPDPHHPYPITPQYYLAEMSSPEDIEVLVSQDDFESALRSLIPSVSQAEMEHYARVQQQFSKETINHDM